MPADDVIIDYAMPLMNIERMAKETHLLCLENKYAEARELSLKMASECRVLYVTLQIMQERQR